MRESIAKSKTFSKANDLSTIWKFWWIQDLRWWTGERSRAYQRHPSPSLLNSSYSHPSSFFLRSHLVTYLSVYYLSIIYPSISSIIFYLSSVCLLATYLSSIHLIFCCLFSVFICYYQRFKMVSLISYSGNFRAEVPDVVHFKMEWK